MLRPAGTSQSHAATTRKPFTSAPSRISRDRPPQPITPTRTVSLAGALPSSPRAGAETKAGRAAAAPALSISRRVQGFRDMIHSSHLLNHIDVLRGYLRVHPTLGNHVQTLFETRRRPAAVPIVPPRVTPVSITCLAPPRHLKIGAEISVAFRSGRPRSFVRTERPTLT